MTAALEVRGLGVRFGAVDVVEDLDLTLRRGTVTGLIGPNGAGKTTALEAISGLVPATGRVALGGIPLERLAPHRRARLGLSRTFQSQELFEDLTVAENLLVAGGAGVGDERLPAELTHAERSALALDRALAGRPSVLLLDEPAAGLDSTEAAHLFALIRRLEADLGLTVLLVEHYVKAVLENCDLVYVLNEGRLIAAGGPDEIVAHPEVRAAYLGNVIETGESVHVDA